MSANGSTAQLPPQNLEAEESVLGAMLVSESAITPVILEVRLHREDFYRERHRLVFEAVRGLYEEGEPVDSLTVTERLAQRGELDQAGGRDVLTSLAASTPSAGNARHYAKIVKQNALLRRLLAATYEIQQSVGERTASPELIVEDAERLLFQVAHEERAGEFRRLSEVLASELPKLEAMARGDLELTGTASGFRDFDALTGGFQPGNLVIVAARPAMGKSAFVANIAEHVALRHGQAVAFFSLEMSETELAQRFLASQAKISGDRIRKGQVGERDFGRVVRAANAFDAAPLWIDDSSDLSLLELRAKARRLHAQEVAAGGGLALILIDYLQLMRPEEGQSRVEQVSAISRGLKILARELQVPVLALSQLSRAPEQRPDKRPVLSDLRESGQIEQDADLVCFLYRDEYYNEDTEREGIADLLVAKHRNGPTRDVELVFLSQYPKFADLSRDRREPAGAGVNGGGAAPTDPGPASPPPEEAF